MKRMLLRILPLAAALLLVSNPVPAISAEIGSAAAFVAIANDPAGDYTLVADIDLTGSGYTTLPCFSGLLDGAGHTLSGLGAQSLFVTNAGAVVNLTLDGTVSGANTLRKATDVGMFCDIVAGGAFTNCTVEGWTLRNTGTGSIGLFAGTVREGTFSRCSTETSCEVVSAAAKATVGCFAGDITGSAPVGTVASFVDCTNRASILVTTGDYAARGKAGFVGKITGVVSASIPEVAFIRCVNAGTMNQSAKFTNLGGFVGIVYGNGEKQQDGIIRFVDCVNESDITASDSQSSCAAGFVAATSSISLEFSGCVNRGDILCAATAAGFVGQISEYGKSVGNGNILLNSANYGNVTGTNNVGGLIGTISWNAGYNRGQLHVRNCATYGTLATGESGNKGEIMAKASSGTSNGVIIEFTNVWTPTSALYVSSAKTPTVSNVQSADAAGYTHRSALASLNAVANANESFEQWAIGRFGPPELRRFATPCYTLILIR